MVKKNFLNFKFFIVIFLFLLDSLGLLFLKGYFNLSLFADLMNAIIAFSVGIFAFYCYAHSDKKQKRFLFFLFLAFISRFFGEIFWVYYDFSPHLMPAFSFADLFWVFSNLMIIFAFETKLRDSNFKKKKAVTFFTTILLILSVIFLLGIYYKLKTIDSSLWFSYIVNESYVLFDLFILTLLMTPLYFSVEKNKKSFLFYFFLASGFLAVIIYDYLFAETYLAGTYFSGGKLEILYFLSYSLFYLAFYFKEKNLKK